MKKRWKQRKISQTMVKWLLVCVVISFAMATLLTHSLQTKLSEKNTEEVLRLNIEDVQQDILDASDKNLLSIARNIAAYINAISQVDRAYLQTLAKSYQVAEVNVISPQGIITESTFEEFYGFDMASGAQSSEFLCLLNGEKEFAQSYQPISWQADISRKYAGVALDNGGFVQVGYDFEQFRKVISEKVAGTTKNRRVGEDGRILIVDQNGQIVSDRGAYKKTSLEQINMDVDFHTLPEWTVFEAGVYNVPSYCMYAFSEGYHILSVLPQSEATVSRNVAVRTTIVMESIVLALLFVLITVLMKRLVVDNIHRVNASLSAISDGQLDTVVDVRSHEEFNDLSNDINATVDTLKRYIADAAARLDAELAFAKAIQHSAMPSVFPPYPGRKEFDIHAAMYTAKEVGGDFYDFYFVDEDTLAFLIADVSGKGIPAALFMMQSKTLLKSCMESGMRAEEAFTLANEKLCEGNDAGMFVTAWLGCLNVKTGLVTFANAGHNPPAVRQGKNAFAYHKTRAGFVLAGMEGIRYRKFELQLQPGDTLYLYTDGVTEATDANEALYGESRLLQVLDSACGETAQGICQAVKQDVDAFVGEAEQFDDITMLCLTYRGPKPDGPEKEITLAAVTENLDAVTAFVNAQLEEMGCPTKTRMQIDMAIDEIFSNIAHYAYAPEKGEATVQVNQEEKAAVITFIDQGIPYNPLTAADPDTTLSAEERGMGGLGIFMVKKTMDDMQYRYQDGKNILSIRKNIRS